MSSCGKYLNFTCNFLTFLALLQDEKNQILTTNVWLNLVSQSRVTQTFYFKQKLKYFSSNISFLSVLFSSNVVGRSLDNFCMK